MRFSKYVRDAVRAIIRWSTMNETKSRYVDDSAVPAGSMGMTISKGSSLESRNGMGFTVFDATGGKVIQVSTYDPRTDRHGVNLYVITDKENLGEELGLIITKERLTR